MYVACPRCSREWFDKKLSNEIWHCVCGMRHHACDVRRSFFCGDQDSEYIPIILWDFTKHVCRYGPQGSIYSGAKLPWLPFDITLKQLTKYLVLA